MYVWLYGATIYIYNGIQKRIINLFNKEDCKANKVYEGIESENNKQQTNTIDKFLSVKCNMPCPSQQY